MNTLKLSLVCASLALLLIGGPSLPPAAPSPATADWQTTFQQRLPVYGHRNWIIVSDAAFPAYSQSGIETIVANDDLPSVLNYVAQAISSSKHVRATVFLDQELQFVQEKDYPGVTHLREEITSAFAKNKLSSIPHSEVLSKIDDAGKTFRVLFIKTNTTIPYTSVYMRMNCGYMTDEIENKIRNAVGASANK
jgi:L-fucose mutarotase/ribose pyranase (RbsD/FucU family)